MAFSVLSCIVEKTIIEEKRCVEKTWPNFFDDLQNKVGQDLAPVSYSSHADWYRRRGSRARAVFACVVLSQHYPER